jgi:hypothetical protein
MNWIKVRTNLVRDGRVVSLAIKLKSHPVFVCGALTWLWSCADEQTTDGKLHGYTPDYIDFQVNIPGFTMALTELTKDGKPSPWVIVTPEYVAVCEFGKHNGATAKQRAQSASRMSRKRYADSVTPAQRKAHLDKSKAEQSREDKESAFKQAPEPSSPRLVFSSPEDALLALQRLGIKRETADTMIHDHGLERISWAANRFIEASRKGKKHNPAGWLIGALNSPDGPAPPAPIVGRIPKPADRSAALKTIASYRTKP